MIPLSDDNPTSIKPIVTITFVVACVLVFLWQFSLGPERGQMVIYSLGVIPAVLLGQPDEHRRITARRLHCRPDRAPGSRPARWRNELKTWSDPT